MRQSRTLSRSLRALAASLLLACGASTPAPAPHDDLRIADLPPAEPTASAPVASAGSASSSAEPAPLHLPPPEPELDRVARALAGLDASPGFAAHARAVDGHHRAYEERLGERLVAWAGTELGDSEGATVLYPFSGPDFLTAHRMFPRARRYVLVSREAAGRVGTLRELSGARGEDRLEREARTLEGFLRRGFFLTRDMGRDFPEGVAGTLAAFAALEGFVVEGEATMSVSAAGELVPDARGSALRLSLRRRDGTAAVLDFVATDLSDPWLRRAPGVARWLASVAGDRALLKAASHLPQQLGFRAVRDVIVEHARVLAQDETGVDYAALTPAFDVALYGSFTHVNALFASTPQRALAAAFRERTDVRPLPFTLGYKKRSGSCLMIARRR